MQNAALVGLMQSNLETDGRRTGGYTLLVSLVAILGRSVSLFGIYWPSHGEG